MSRRRRFLAGNWKMNCRRESAQRLAQALGGMIGSVREVDVAVFPPFPYLAVVQEALFGSQIRLGAQNAYFESDGAFTGEVSPAMLADCGCKYVILGHSERRHLLGETDDLINRKLHAALAAGLLPILCVGEQLAERDAGRAEEIVGNQLRLCLVGVRPEQLRCVTIAYEPVWAIGTGKVATPEQAEEMHAFLRQQATKMYGADLAQCLCIQYGGSVKPDNIAGLLAKPNVDGALVGGASLKAEDFAAIVRAGVDAASSA